MGPMFLSIFFRQTVLLVDGGHSIYRVYSHRSKKNAIIGLAVLKLSNFKFDLHGVLLSLTCVMLHRYWTWLAFEARVCDKTSRIYILGFICRVARERIVIQYTAEFGV